MSRSHYYLINAFVMMLLLLGSLPSGIVSAQDIGVIRQFGSSDDDRIHAIAVDDASNVYVSGFTAGALPSQTKYGPFDAFVGKYDAGGTLLWMHQFGGGGTTVANGIGVDVTGNVYVAGHTDGSLINQVPFSSLRIFLRKYAPDGTEVWTRQFEGTYLYGTAVDSVGNTYLAGAVYGALPGHTSAGDADIFVKKYDTAGNNLWARQFGSSQQDFPRTIRISKSGHVIVGGSTRGQLPGQVYTDLWSYSDAFVRVYDADGNVIWTRQFTSSSEDRIEGVAGDTIGNVYVVGNADSALPGQTTSGAFVRKYDSDGGEIWTQQFGNIGNGVGGSASDIAIDQASILYVSGAVWIPSEGNSDAFVRAYNTDGNDLWTRVFGTSNNDYSTRVAAKIVGAFVAGYTFGVFPSQISSGNPDAFVTGFVSLNHPPIAATGGSYLVGEGGSTLVTASGSDPEGTPLTYSWDLDNNGSFETPGQNTIFSAAGLDGPSSLIVTVRVTDSGGLSATDQATVNVLNVAPTVNAPSVTSEPSTEGDAVIANATFTDPAPNDAAFTCTVNYGDGSGDLLSIVTGNTCTGPSHPYASFGLYTVTVRVTDKDNDTGINFVAHGVIFDFNGFFQPVDNIPTLNMVNAGRAIPVKFSLSGDEGLSIFASGFPKSEAIVCDSTALVDGVEETVTAGSSSLSYNPSADQYTYVWKSDKAWAGTCRQLVVKLNDGSYHRANFKFK